ncbi:MULTISPECIES: 3-oxoacyl-ACP synthase III family protein [Streptosporangium]|uniref:3-oxoacyl-[acyl-carrier-protein] synthase-3 n=1 Tax=Streptosporangium brasiliense TaxID=47480 RepID=A0ABT9R401_9ACTN|nr:3-oxoacyl-[acyl-carrier-protein] synthase III C-terminal domain-containing protein [Streptosporangium brasiliense]MDP9863949.1 3-oxoacyl-[acyl-carrier-protein] synthase-3 [Streptosporangium brasiliense]
MGGIADLEVAFPTSRVSVRHMSAMSGVPVPEILEITHSRSFPVLGPDERSWELALEAARAVLKRTQVEPGAIRQVIFAGSGEWDVPFWSPAARVALGLGIERAHCFEIGNFCNAGMTAVRTGLDGIAAGRAEYVLVLVGDRLGTMVDYRDPGSKALFNLGDAAAAMLLAREDYAFEVLHSAMRTDPSWSDYYTGEHRPDRVVIRRNGHRGGLAAAYVENFTALVGETLGALGARASDVSHFLINQGDRSMHERLLRETGIPADRSVFNYDRLGHMGGADTMIALRGLLDGGGLRHGDLILLATSAMGFSWGVMALRYRPDGQV